MVEMRRTVQRRTETSPILTPPFSRRMDLSVSGPERFSPSPQASGKGLARARLLGHRVPAFGQLRPATTRTLQRQPQNLYEETLSQKEPVEIEGESHTLYPEIVEGELELMIASTPVVLRQFLLSEHGQRLDSATRKRLAYLANQLTDTLSTWKANLGRALGRILENIASLLEKSETGGVVLPKTQANWPTVGKTSITKTNVVNTYDAGLEMLADPLSLRPGDTHGAQPASEGLGSGLIWGHLLNHKLHGPNDHKNLVPISQNLNGLMESQVEDVVKQAVLSENKVVRYGVKVTDIGAAKSVNLLATKLTFELKELDWDDGAEDWVPAGTQPGSFGAVDGKVLQAKRDLAARLEEEETPLRMGREKHRLFIDLRDGVPRLKIASDPLLLDDYLGSAEGKKLDEKSYKAILRLSNQYDDIVSGYKNDLGRYVKLVLANLAAALRNADRGALELPATKTSFYTRGAKVNDRQINVGKKMLSAPLSLRPGDTVGSEPSEESIRSGFIWGHLLNHNLHGPAELRNLMPITASFNQTMERQVESDVKEAVLGKGRVVHYGVEVVGETSIDEIDWVPTKLKITLKQLKPFKRLKGGTGWTLLDESKMDPDLKALDGKVIEDNSKIVRDDESFEL